MRVGSHAVERVPVTSTGGRGAGHVRALWKQPPQAPMRLTGHAYWSGRPWGALAPLQPAVGSLLSPPSSTEPESLRVGQAEHACACAHVCAPVCASLRVCVHFRVCSVHVRARFCVCACEYLCVLVPACLCAFPRVHCMHACTSLCMSLRVRLCALSRACALSARVCTSVCVCKPVCVSRFRHRQVNPVSSKLPGFESSREGGHRPRPPRASPGCARSDLGTPELGRDGGGASCPRKQQERSPLGRNAV